MGVLPPGTILQLLYLRERLERLVPGRFIEIGPGSGEISGLLLELGWVGTAYDLEERTVDHLSKRFSLEISDGRYAVVARDYLSVEPVQGQKVDLIISCMVMEHLDDELESRFMQRSFALLNPNGLMIGLVPASEEHWGIEDDIAGHLRRYTRDKLKTLADQHRYVLQHLAGLTFPVSNLLLPVSNYIVMRAERSKIVLSNLEKTKASGIRKVQFKTEFPGLLSLLLNRYVLLPLHWLQKAFSSSSRALVLYFEVIPSGEQGHSK